MPQQVSVENDRTVVRDFDEVRLASEISELLPVDLVGEEHIFNVVLGKV